MSAEVQFSELKDVLEMDGGDSCPKMSVTKATKLLLEIFKNGKFYMYLPEF